MTNFIWKEHDIPNINDNDKLVFPSWALPKKIYQLFYKEHKFWIIDWGNRKESLYKGLEINIKNQEYFMPTKKSVELLVFEELKRKRR